MDTHGLRCSRRVRKANLLVSCGTHVAQTRVLPLAVVPLFNKILTGLSVRRPVMLPDEFMLQLREEALRHGVNDRVIFPTFDRVKVPTVV